MWDAVYDVKKIDDTKNAKWLSALYFGERDAPKQIESMVFSEIKQCREAFENQRRAARHIFRDRGLVGSWRETADELLYLYSRMRDLSAITNGAFRAKGASPEYHGVETAYLEELGKYSAGAYE